MDGRLLSSTTCTFAQLARFPLMLACTAVGRGLTAHVQCCRAHACGYTRTCTHSHTHCGGAGRILGGPAAALESSTDLRFVKPPFLWFGDAQCVKQDCLHARGRFEVPDCRPNSPVTALILRQPATHTSLTPVGLERRFRRTNCLQTWIRTHAWTHECADFVSNETLANTDAHARVDARMHIRNMT